MSNSSLVNVKVPAYNGNYSQGRSGRKIEMITLHHMAGILTAEQCGRIFQQVGRQASANYGVGCDCKVALYVDEENASWANTHWDSNCKAVTVEISNCEIGGNYKVADDVLKKVIELVADIVKRNNLGKLVKGKNLTWHSMYYATACPGKYLLSKIDYIVEKVNQINGYVERPVQPTKKSNDEIANEVISGKWGNGAERQVNLTNAGYNYDEVQAKVNELLGVVTKANLKPIEEVAREVIRGEWGNGQDRVNRLTQAGYNYNEVQAKVNELM